MRASKSRKGLYRSVSLYWSEKVWLLVDGLQLLATLLAALQPSLPYGWNVWARLTSLFLLDIVGGLLRSLPPTNELGPYPLNAAERAILLLVLLLLILAAAAAWPRAVYALELYEREEELEKIRKEQELARLRRPSQARPSVTAMLALSMQPAPPSCFSRCRKTAAKCWKVVVIGFYTFLGWATRMRAALTLFLLPAFLALEVPLIFCSDQANACESTGLLIVRILCFVGVVGLLYHTVLVLLRDLREASVARHGRQQEEYLKQREIEYLLFINNDWMERKMWLVSSFKGGIFSSYFRLWLLLLKAALIVSSALLGQIGSKIPTGLGWLASVGRTRDAAAAAAAAAKAASGTLAEAIAAEPLGEGARTAAAAALVLIFSFFSITRPPFRCRSTNCMHLVVFLHLGGISGIGLAAAGADAKRNSFLLYSNQHLLLAAVHICSLCLLLVTAFCCCIFCLTPTESVLLQRYEVTMGYTGSNSNSNWKEAEGGRSIKSLFVNIGHICRACWCKCGGDGSAYGSWSSGDSSCTLEIGETEIKEKYYNLKPFEAPWPTRPQHARFWIRVAPRLVEQLASASRLLERYATADKQLLPVHLVNVAFRKLEAIVVQHIGAVEERDTRRRSKRHSRKNTTEEQQQTLEQLMKELGAGQPAAADADTTTHAELVNSQLSDVWDNSQSGDHEPEEAFVFRQRRQDTDESLWSVDSAAEAATAAAEAAIHNALAFRHLERAAHLSSEFPGAKLDELQNLRTIIKGVEWTVAEIFEKMSAIRSVAATESIWQDAEAPPPETQKLLHDFAIHLKRRKRQLVLLQPVRKRILLKLLALRFITDTQQQREKREKERKRQMAELFGEESSIMFFMPKA